MTQQITAYAAAAAAAFSLLNVFLSNRSTRVGQMHQWRRTNARETMAAFAEDLQRIEALWLKVEQDRVLDNAANKVTKSVDAKTLAKLGPMPLLAAWGVVAYAGWGHKKIVDEVKSLVDKLQKQLIEIRLSTSASCYESACQYAHALEKIVRCRVLSTDSTAQVELSGDDINDVKMARSEFFKNCRIDLGVERRRRRLPLRKIT